MKNKKLASLILLLFGFSSSVFCQINIGIDVVPAKGAILQLRDKKTIEADNVTAEKGGLVLPRVNLQNINSLAPFVDEGDADYESQKLLHVGMVVYNMTINESKQLTPASYVWNGTTWRELESTTGNFWLTTNPSGLIVFPSGEAGGQAIVPLPMNIKWYPTNYVAKLTLAPNINGGVVGFAPPAISDKSGDYTFQVNVDKIPSANIQEGLFYERSSNLIIEASDGLGKTIARNITILQKNHAILVEGLKPYMEMNRTHYILVKSNTAWKIELNDPNLVVDNISQMSLNSEVYTETLVTLKLKEAEANLEKTFTLTFASDRATVAEKEFQDQTFTATVSKDYSNAIIVAPGNSIDIPIRKAYAIWKNEFDVDLPDTGIDVEVVWEDKSSIDNVTLPTSNGIKSVMRVVANANLGNAVVAVKIGGVIRWSWHIWVTDYNPNSSQPSVPGGTSGSTAVVGGDIYTYFNGTKQTTILDRPLGAIELNPTVYEDGGLVYQAGRKDPLSLYDAFITSEADDQYQQLEYAIENPNTYLVGSIPNNNIWYTNVPGKKRNDFWDSKYGYKTEYDPCPDGWRVPEFRDSSGEKTFENLPYTSPTIINGLNVFDYRPHGLGLMYPIGLRRLPLGDLAYQSRNFYMWGVKSELNVNETFAVTDTAQRLNNPAIELVPVALAIRCAKDE